MTAYPEARREDVTYTMGGLDLQDPYRWLEDDTEEALAWQAEQNKLAEDALRTWPHFEDLRTRIEALTVDARVSAPVQRGRWFRLVAPTKDADQLVLMVSDSPHEKGTVLVDPNALTLQRGVPVGLDWWVPSRDGRYVAYGVSEGGTEQSVLRVIDTHTREHLPDEFPFCGASAVSWLPDSSGFFFTGGVEAQTVTMQRYCWMHTLGDTERGVRQEADVAGNLFAAVTVSHDGRWALMHTGTYEVRPWYIKDLASGGDWTPFLRDLEGPYQGFVEDGAYIAYTTDGAPHGKVVSIPLSTALDRSTWTEIVRESDIVIRGAANVGGRLGLTVLDDAVPRARLYGFDGTRLDDIPAPGPGAITVASAQHDSSLVTFLYSAFDTSPSVYLYDVDSSELTELDAPKVKVDGIVQERRYATSEDGTRVPLFLWRRADVALDTPRPTLIYGYGGFNIPHSPAYSPAWLSFVESGGVFVMPNLRGGGEFGAAWWKDGRLANKFNTFRDLFATAEDLFAEGITTKDQLGVVGASNGGLLTGAALTQRPDLWRAVVSIVPVYDLFRTAVKDPYTSYATINEYGNPNDPEQARWLIEYSPYHNVRDDTKYPSILISAGDRDVRCPPWHARKLTAALQHATTSGRPVLLRVQDEAGHGPGKPSSVAITNFAEYIGFVMRETGLRP